MASKIRFGSWEGIMLLVGLMTFKLTVAAVNVFTITAGTAAWIMALYAGITAVFLVSLMLFFLKSFPSQDILDITENTFGQAAKKAAASVAATILFANTATLLHTVAQANHMTSFTQTPIGLILFFYIAITVLAAYAGFEAIVRIHSFWLPAAALICTLVLATGLPLLKADNLMPILGNGAVHVFADGLSGISAFNEFMVFLLMIPFLGDIKIARKTAIWGIGISCFFTAACVTYYTMLVPYPLAGKLTLPFYEIVRILSTSRTSQWFESVFFILWVFGMLLYAAANLYLICHVISKAFDLKSTKALILPIAATLLFAAGAAGKAFSADQTLLYNKYIGIFSFLLPLALLAAARLKHKKQQTNT